MRTILYLAPGDTLDSFSDNKVINRFPTHYFEYLGDTSKFTGYLGRVLGKCVWKSLRPPYFFWKNIFSPLSILPARVPHKFCPVPRTREWWGADSGDCFSSMGTTGRNNFSDQWNHAAVSDSTQFINPPTFSDNCMVPGIKIGLWPSVLKHQLNKLHGHGDIDFHAITTTNTRSALFY